MKIGGRTALLSIAIVMGLQLLPILGAALYVGLEQIAGSLPGVQKIPVPTRVAGGFIAIAVFALFLVIPYRAAVGPFTRRRRNEALLLEGMILFLCLAAAVGNGFSGWALLYALSSVLIFGLLSAAPVTNREPVTES